MPRARLAMFFLVGLSSGCIHVKPAYLGSSSAARPPLFIHASHHAHAPSECILVQNPRKGLSVAFPHEYREEPWIVDVGVLDLDRSSVRLEVGWASPTSARATSRVRVSKEDAWRSVVVQDEFILFLSLPTRPASAIAGFAMRPALDELGGSPPR